MTTWALILLGGMLVGMLLGALGAGGSVLTLPIFVLVFRQEVAVASASSLVVVALIAASSVFGHAKRGNILYRSAALLSVTAGVGSTLGAWAVKKVPSEAFLLGFSGLLLVGAIALWRVPLYESDVAPDCFTQPSWKSCGRLGIVGLAIGFLTGFFGVGGGFLIVPALVVGMGFPMQKAVGTSLVVVMVAALTGLLSHLKTSLPWAQVLPFAVAGTVGSYVGQKAARRMNAQWLRRGFAVGLMSLAVFLVARTWLS